MFPVGRSLVAPLLCAIFLLTSVDVALAAPGKASKSAPAAKHETVTPANLSADKLLEEAIMGRGLADFEGSQRKLEQALKLSKVPAQRARIHLLMGANYLDMGKDPRARDAMLAALGLDPDIKASTEMKTAVKNLLSRIRKVARGSLKVHATPTAAVEIDGKTAGKTPYTAKLTIGSHRITLTGPGGVKEERAVVVYPARTATLKVKFKVARKEAKHAGKRGRLWTWIVGATAVAVAGAGLGTWLWADSDYSAWQAEDVKPAADQARLDELADGIRTKEIASYALWGTAGALAVTSVVLFIMEPGMGAGKQERASASLWDRLSITPVAGQATGLLLQGSF